MATVMMREEHGGCKSRARSPTMLNTQQHMYNTAHAAQPRCWRNDSVMTRRQQWATGSTVARRVSQRKRTNCWLSLCQCVKYIR